MRPTDINKKVILDRIDIIQKSLDRLNLLNELPTEKFEQDDNFAIAEHYLRYALEAVFDISAHLLSRIPGAYVGEYKKMALELGKQGIVSQEFADGPLSEMAGYRIRLTHFYLEVTPREMHEIVRNNLGDFDIFLKHIKNLLE